MYKDYYPQTIEEAQAFVYGEWAGEPKGRKYQESRCSYEVFSRYYFGGRQCARSNGYGDGKLYCKQHARKLGMNL